MAEICRRLDGIPLAIELAAARVAGLPLDEIANRISESFDLLIARGHSRPARHQTLRAALEWSHELLSEPERSVFRRLGVFSGGWTLAAAEFVCPGVGVDARDVADLLAALVEQSLAVLEGESGEMRYRLLEPVRLQAQGYLAASNESENVRNRHRAYFVQFAERAGPEMHRAEQAAWAGRIDRDLDNLRSAVRSAETASDADTALRIAGALWWYLWVRGRMRDGLRWLESARDKADVTPMARMAGLRAAGMLLGATGQSDAAAASAGALIELARGAGDHAEIGRALTLRGMEHFRSGDPVGAEPVFVEALAEARIADNAMLIPNALVNLGQIAAARGDLERAEDLYREGLERFEAEGDLWGVAYASNNLSCLLRDRGEVGEAVRLSLRATELLDQIGDRFYVIFALEDLARAVARTGRWGAAAQLFGAANGLRLATGALLPPGGQGEHDRDLEQLRSQLGERRFAKAWQTGREERLALLLAELRGVGTPDRRGTPAAGGPGGQLTARELEVAKLIERGFTNRQVADALVITPGTVGVHVEHILAKLDLQSRHQVGDWIRAQEAPTD